jgi:hypothetical protein
LRLASCGRSGRSAAPYALRTDCGDKSRCSSVRCESRVIHHRAVRADRLCARCRNIPGEQPWFCGPPAHLRAICRRESEYRYRDPFPRRRPTDLDLERRLQGPRCARAALAGRRLPGNVYLLQRLEVKGDLVAAEPLSLTDRPRRLTAPSRDGHRSPLGGEALSAGLRPSPH